LGDGAEASVQEGPRETGARRRRHFTTTRVTATASVVEDDDAVRELIVNALADNGYEVDLAADGAGSLMAIDVSCLSALQRWQGQATLSAAS
jgi:hypothetical protein